MRNLIKNLFLEIIQVITRVKKKKTNNSKNRGPTRMQSISVVEALELDVSETKYPDFLHEVGGGGKACSLHVFTAHPTLQHEHPFKAQWW